MVLLMAVCGGVQGDLGLVGVPRRSIGVRLGILVRPSLTVGLVLTCVLTLAPSSVRRQARVLSRDKLCPSVIACLANSCLTVVILSPNRLVRPSPVASRLMFGNRALLKMTPQWPLSTLGVLPLCNPGKRGAVAE